MCIYIYTCKDICIYIYNDRHTHTHIYMYIYIYSYDIYIYVCLFMYLCIYLFMHNINDQPWPLRASVPEESPWSFFYEAGCKTPEGKEVVSITGSSNCEGRSVQYTFWQVPSMVTVTPNGELHHKKKGLRRLRWNSSL